MWTLLAILACAPEAPVSLDASLQQATIARAGRRVGEAEALLAPLRKTHADNARVWMESARLRQLQNDNPGAAEAYKTATVLAPDALDLKLHHAVFMIGRQRNQTGALALLSEVWLAPEGVILGEESLDVIQAEALRNIAIAYQELGYAGLSATVVGRWRAMPARNTKHEVIGTAVMQRVMPAVAAAGKRQHAEALDAIMGGLETDPQGAVDAIDALLSSEPTMLPADTIEANLGLGSAYRRLGEHTESVKALEVAREAAKTAPPLSTMTINLELARTHAQAGETEQAMKRLEALLWWSAVSDVNPGWPITITTDPALVSLGAAPKSLLQRFAHRVK